MEAHRRLGPGVGFSPQHAIAVAEGAAHHQRSKTYSGMLLRPHKPFLTALIQRLGITSALDYGAGKGLQYEWLDPTDGKTLEEAWGLNVTKYDPCWPPYAAEPKGTFGLVMCTHTLTLIPLGDLDSVIERLFRLADRAVFVAEKIGERKKREVADPEGRPIGWTVDGWLDRIGPIAERYPQIETTVSTRERIDGAAIMRRHRLSGGRWAEVSLGGT